MSLVLIDILHVLRIMSLVLVDILYVLRLMSLVLVDYIARFETYVSSIS